MNWKSRSSLIKIKKKDALLMQFRSTASDIAGGGQTTSVHHAASVLPSEAFHRPPKYCAQLFQWAPALFFFK